MPLFPVTAKISLFDKKGFKNMARTKNTAEAVVEEVKEIENKETNILDEEQLENFEVEQVEVPEVDMPDVDGESYDDMQGELDALDKMLDEQASVVPKKRGRKKKSESDDTVEKVADSNTEEVEKPAPRHRQAKGNSEYIPAGDLVNRASRQEKRALYKEDDVYTINPDGPSIKTEQQKRRETWFKLLQAAENGSALEGTLYSYMIARNKSGKRYVLGIVKFECATVYIPADLLFRFNPEMIRVNEGQTAESAEVNTKAYYTDLRAGMKVKFVVLRAEEKDPLNEEGGPMAYGSRIGAMEKLGYENYYAPSRMDGKPLIIEGMKVEATITCLTRAGIYVDAAGVEEFIPNDELSWRHINDARTDVEDFKVGDVIVVKVMSVEKEPYTALDRSYNLVKLSLSAKEAQVDPNKKYFNSYSIGQRTLATVTSVNDDGVFVRLGGNERDARCQFPRNGLPIPSVGSLVKVKITRKIDGEYKIYADIKDIIRMGIG